MSENQATIGTGTTITHNQQQQPIVITLPPNLTSSQDEKTKIEKTFPQKFMLWLSILQLTFGAIAVLSHIILFNVAADTYGIHEAGFGIWTGVVFAIAGGVGLLGANRPSNCTVVAMLVLSIISSLMTIPLLIFSGIGLGDSNRRIRWRDDDDDDLPSLKASTALYSIQLFIGLAQAVAAITTSAFSCRTVCCRKRSNAGTVIFAPINPNDSQYVFQINAPDANPAAVNNPTTTQDDPPGYSEINLNSDESKYQRFE